MGNLNVSVAAATAVVGYDLFRDLVNQTVPYPRRLTKIGVQGSAAALDTEIELFIGTESRGTWYNTGTGAVTNDAMIDIDEYVPANARISAKVRDAPATNPINVTVITQP